MAMSVTEKWKGIRPLLFVPTLLVSTYLWFTPGFFF